MPLLCTSSRRAGLACSVAVLAVWAAGLAAATPASAAAKAEDGGFGPLGRTLLTAVEASPAGDAVEALGNSLAMLGARYRVDGKAAAEAAPHETAPEQTGGSPSSLPPASAGTNGTKVQRISGLSRERIFAHSRAGANPESTAILLTGIALAPPDAPEAVKGAINAANTIVGRPYIWGGGHASFYSYGYDCSGAVSFALFGGGLIPRPLTSTELEHWGAPGPGRWITVYANAEHTFAEIAGLRWDTVGDANGTGPRWHLAPASAQGFVVRHPPGL